MRSIVLLCARIDVFDGYQLIHMSQTDQEGHGTRLGDQSLFFRNETPIKIGRRIKLEDVRDFRRYQRSDTVSGTETQKA